MNIFQYVSGIKFLEDPRILFPMLVWIMTWKGLALWKASQRKEVLWFWLLMSINTLGILEICYIFVFSNPKTYFKDLKDNLIKKMRNKKEKIIVEPVDEKNI